jgi:hypothetical protein
MTTCVGGKYQAAKAAKDAAFLATGNPLGRTKTDHRAKVIDREAPLRQGQRYCTETIEPLDFDLQELSCQEAAIFWSWSSKIKRSQPSAAPAVIVQAHITIRCSLKRSRSVTAKSAIAKSQSAPIYMFLRRRFAAPSDSASTRPESPGIKAFARFPAAPVRPE